MALPARNTLAVIGAGPIGLEAAVAAMAAGFDVHVFDCSDVAAHPIAWGHVRMFTPWRMNLGPQSRERLAATGWTPPDDSSCPTGLEFAEHYLQPLAALPDLKSRIHTHAQIVSVARRGLPRGAGDRDRRAGEPFRMLVRDAGGRENFLHAFAVIDASGVYGQPRRAGDGGIPARGELYLAPQMSYHVDDVLGLRRARYAGKRTLVLGSGASAATLVSDLVRLAGEAEGTSVVWATRPPVTDCYRENPDDPLPVRRALHERARALLSGSDAAVTPVSGVVAEGIEYNSATHRYRTTLRAGEALRQEESDHIIVNGGYEPDEAPLHELRLDLDPLTRAVAGVAATLHQVPDCVQAKAESAASLAHPEPNLYILGHKSYGRSSHFLLENGYRQVEAVVAALADTLATRP